MAGNYPDVPSWRIPYDRDGTVIVWNNDDVTDTYARTLNDESGSGHVEYAGSPGLIFMFPRLMDLDAYAASRSGYGSPGGGFSWSPDTTNGIDGTWNSLGSWVDCGTGVENIRNNIQGMALSGVRAIRWWTSSNGGVHKIDYIHLYGEPTPGEDTNKLQIVQTATETRVTPAYFDFGDVPRNNTDTKQFRVKNLSSTQTANDVVVSLEVVTDSTPSFDSMHTFEHSGSGYLAQVNIGNLAPEAVSTNIDVRQIIDSNATLSLRTARILAVATSWS